VLLTRIHAWAFAVYRLRLELDGNYIVMGFPHEAEAVVVIKNPTSVLDKHTQCLRVDLARVHSPVGDFIF
jgi:hypothetical protein